MIRVEGGAFIPELGCALGDEKGQVKVLHAMPAASRPKAYAGIDIQANDLIRSFHAVCDRDGERTNWVALGRQVKAVLAEQHQYLHPDQYISPRAG